MSAHLDYPNMLSEEFMQGRRTILVRFDLSHVCRLVSCSSVQVSAQQFVRC